MSPVIPFFLLCLLAGSCRGIGALSAPEDVQAADIGLACRLALVHIEQPYGGGVLFPFNLPDAAGIDDDTAVDLLQTAVLQLFHLVAQLLEGIVPYSIDLRFAQQVGHSHLPAEQLNAGNVAAVQRIGHTAALQGEVCWLHRRIAGHRKGTAQGVYQLVRGFKFIEKLVIMQITQRPIAIVRMG